MTVFGHSQTVAPALDPGRNAAAKLIEGGQFEGALKMLGPLIEKNPKDAFLLRLQGYALLKLGKNDESIAALREATAAAPNDAAAHFFLGNALATSGKPGEATTSFLKVAELDPQSKFAEAVRQLLPQLKEMVEAEAAKPDAPKQQFETVEILVPIEVPPPPPTAEEKLLSAALRDVEAENYEAALPKIETLLKKIPDNFELQKLKGLVLSESGEADEAIAFLMELKVAHPDDAGLRLMLAQALSKDGQLKLAAAELNELIGLGDGETLDASEALLAQVEAGLKAIHKDKWTVFSTLGLEYDTNPAAIPIIGGGGGGESWKSTGSLHVGYEIIDQDRDKFPVSWVVSGTGFQTFHKNSDLRRLDVTLGAVGTYLQLETSFFDRPLTLTTGGDWGKLFLGSEEYFHYTNGSAKADWRTFENAGVTVGYQYAHEEYVEDTTFPDFFSLDGDTHRGSIGGYAFLFEDKLLLTASYSLKEAHREGVQFESEAHSATFGSRIKLPWKTELVGSVNYTTEDYGLFSPQPSRLDDVWNYTLALEKQLWVDGLKSVVSYSKTIANSNQDFFNYDRELFGVALRYEY